MVNNDNNKIGFFQEREGVYSYTRLTSFIAFILACILAVYSVYNSVSNFDLIVTFLAYSGGQKIAQKFTEQKPYNNNKNDYLG